MSSDGALGRYGPIAKDTAPAFEPEALQREYSEIQQAAHQNGASEYFLMFTKMFAEGHWRRYQPKLELFRTPLVGKTFVDYGSKYGFLTPLLFKLGVDRVICVDVDEKYLIEGKKYFGDRYKVEFVQSSLCITPCKPSIADFVFVNEVLSHINADLLPAFYTEITRILRDGGEIVISDGNNMAHLETRIDLIKSYEVWENGGSREWGDVCYRKKRAELIARKFPELDTEAVSYLANNTSGLWGDSLFRAASEFLNGTFVERPYRLGTPPTNPRTGAMMERGFFPEEVERSLQTFGFDTAQILKRKPVTDPAQRGATKNFIVWGRKCPQDVETLIAQAKADHYRWYGVDPDKALKEAAAAAAQRESKRPWWQKCREGVQGR